MSSKHLEELDLSFNDLLPHKMDIIFSYIRENKKIMQLNISHNSLIEGNSGNNFKQVMETETKVTDHLFTFLKTNKKLIHLDLTATNLSENAMLQILPAIRKAKSMQGIHLSGNPGITEHLKNEVQSLLKTKPKNPGPKLILSKVLLPETLKQLEKSFLQESVKIKHINSGKRIV